MKKLPAQRIEGMTIFGIGLGIGLFGVSLIEKAPTSFNPKLVYVLGLILLALGFYYLWMSVAHTNAKE
ncbi:hypothetical protein ISS07_03650 [Candidatus Woesearchaeota archaeon]|nr:hypothetical protein [Candidatus Woesearchaeota archaeon]